jgi:hypothetical protein
MKKVSCPTLTPCQRSMFQISMINSGQAGRRQRRVAGVARRAVVRASVHRRGAPQLPLAPAVLLRHLGHVPFQRRELSSTSFNFFFLRRRRRFEIS